MNSIQQIAFTPALSSPRNALKYHNQGAEENRHPEKQIAQIQRLHSSTNRLNLLNQAFVFTGSDLPTPVSHSVLTISPSPDSVLAVQVKQTGLRANKHLFVFERYSGALGYDPDQPLFSTLRLRIDAASVVCRNVKSVDRLTRFARDEALLANDFPEITMRSERLTAKPLRGFVLEGTVALHGVDRAIKANVGFGPLKNGRVNIDADSAIRLSDFDLPRPSRLFGLIRIEDEVVLHASLWGILDGPTA